jgi:hypothetical protein
MNKELKLRMYTVIGIGGTFACLAIALSVNDNSNTQPTLKSPSSPSDGRPAESADLLPQQVSSSELKALVDRVEEEGFDCEPIPDDSWLTQELRKRGAKGIDPGPYKIIHKDLTIQDFPEYSDLPNLVYPEEQFCIKKVEPQSFNINPAVKHGVVFERSNRSLNNMFTQNSGNIQAQIRAKLKP